MTKKTDDLDLYSLLEILWREKLVIFFFLISFPILTSLYIKYLIKPTYETSIIAIGVDASIIDQFNINSLAEESLFTTSAPDWLNRVQDNILDMELLYTAFHWAKNGGGSGVDWLVSDQKKELLLVDQWFYENFVPRISVRQATKNTFSLNFISDTYDGGHSISKFILKSAQEKALRQIYEEHLTAVESLLRDTSFSITQTIYVLQVLSTASLNNLDKDYDLTLAAAKAELMDASNLLERIETENNQKLFWQPRIKLAEISKSLPPTTSGDLRHKRFYKTLTSATFFGALLGILVALLFDGFKRRKIID